MSTFHLIYGIWLVLSMRFSILDVSTSCYPYQFFRQSNRKFEQKTDRFWKFSEIDDRWIEVKLPCDLVPCVDKSEERLEQEHGLEVILPLRKRISLTKMSDSSVWIIGESGLIYERFWNGLEWVIAPHDLPISQGRAVAVFIISQKLLALSESGNLYQMHVQLGETSQPVWIEFTHTLDQISDTDSIFIKSGVVSDDRKGYFCTKKGTLVELAEVEPPRWINHGQPGGANVAAIADVTSSREVMYTISSAGDLYEYNSKSKPSWKKHIWQEKKAQVSSLIPSKGCTLHGLIGDHSESLFLLTKEGTLVERRLHQRKWKWIVHGNPPHQNLTSITPSLRDDSSETSISLFFTTSVGSVFEYQIPKQLGTSPNNQFPGGEWISHQHPLYAKVARGKPGLPLQVGRILFILDDGRVAELHLAGLGGESAGPSMPQNFRRKTSSTKYVWSILDAPESEGWNADYCTEERGPRNCMTGIKDESKDSGITSSVTGRRKQSQENHYYLSLGVGNELISSLEENKYNLPDDWISSNFRLRLMYEGKSFFLVTSDGLIFEHVCIESVWIWLKHDSSTEMNGIVGNYNGSLFMVDTFGSVLLREWSGNEIAWKNCTDMRRGKNIVVGGQPWDRLPGIARRVTTEDSLFFVSKNGRLMQFTVYMRKFKWKDCKNPPNVKVANIVDQELFRDNIIFVTGRNGRLYQYNKVNDLWHEHYQSQHLILSNFPGTVIRPMSKSLTGSIFMLSRDGGLVEYNWNTWHEWNWIEHGTPYKGVTLVGSPGPSFEGNQLLLIGSDGRVYLRYMEKNAWKWKDCGFPTLGDKTIETEDREGEFNDEDTKKEQENLGELSILNCDPKVRSTRPIPFSADSAIFELRDGRLAEIQIGEGKEWVWSRIIGTPNSLCIQNYWITVASSPS